MNKIKLVVETSALEKVIKDMNKIIISPKLTDISYGIRFHIAQRGKVGAAYKRSGVSPSVGDERATTHTIFTKKLKSHISPVVSDVFLANKEGYTSPYLKYADEDEGVREWVLLNYNNISEKNRILNEGVPLVVRARDDYNGFNKPPLGSPERDYFKLGLQDFIINKNKYGLS